MTVAALALQAHAGVGALRFEGVLARGARHDRRLRAGRYTVVITAANAAGRSTPQLLTFTIIA